MLVVSRLRWLVLGVLGVLAWPAPARACSCGQGGAGRFYLGEHGHLPADTPGIPYYGPFPLAGDADHRPAADGRVRLMRRDGDHHIPVGFTISRHAELELIVPSTGLAPGDTYLVRVRSYHYEGEKQAQDMGYGGQPELFAEVTVRPGALPLRGATLELSERTRERVSVPDGGGACQEDVDAAVRSLTVVLPPELEPYRDHLLYVTLVDRERWLHVPSMCSFLDPGRTWSAEPGTDKLFTDCAGAGYGLAAGAHEVAVQLLSPDGTHSFVTPPVRFELDCAPAATPKPAPTSGLACDCSTAAAAPAWLVLVLLHRRRRMTR